MVPCPVAGCPYQAREATLLRWRFFNRHPTAHLHLEENVDCRAVFGSTMPRDLEEV